MAWTVMSDVPNPITNSSGAPYSGAVLKAYLPGTTTSTSIAIDSSGSSPQTTITANSEGKWEVSGNEILPFIDRTHKWAIFANATDATNNTPAYMGFFDNVPQTFASNAFYSSSYSTLAAALTAASGAELIIDDVKTISSNTTISGVSLRFVEGGRIDPDSGITLTVNESITAPAIQIFGGAGLIRGTFAGKPLLLEWWGAVGDGTTAGGGTDDTAAIAACYAAAAAASNIVPVLFLAKKYRITSNINCNANVPFIGAGKERTQIIKDGNFTGLTFTCDRVEISGFHCIGATGNGGIGIDFDFIPRSHIHDVKSSAHGSHGAIVRSGNLARIDACDFDSNSGDGLNWASGTGTQGGGVTANGCYVSMIDCNGNGGIGFNCATSVANIFENIVAQNNTGKGIELGAGCDRNVFRGYEESNGASSTIESGATGNYVTITEGEIIDSGSDNLVLDFNQAGAYRYTFRKLNAHQLRLENRDALQVQYDGLTSDFTVNEVLTSSSGGSAIIAHVEALTSTTGRLSVYGVTGTFLDNDTITSAGGAAVVNTDANLQSQPWYIREASVDGYHILSLQSTSSDTGYIDISREQAGVTLLRNLSGDVLAQRLRNNSVVTFSDGDTTPAVTGSNVFITDSTGTTTITDFDEGAIGQVIHIKAAGACTIQHTNTVIELDGDANFVMAAGDVLTLCMFEDQVWTEVSRTVAA